MIVKPVPFKLVGRPEDKYLDPLEVLLWKTFLEKMKNWFVLCPISF